MAGVWTVARHTLKQSLRMKIVGVFVALLAVALIGMSFTMTGDGTLAGRVRTFLAYSTGVTSILLSLVTIFLSVAVVSADLQNKQIFTIASKPLYRWQYVVGRWLGVMLLNCVLLAVSGGAIYAVAMHMREQKVLNAADRLAVETEVFTARRRVYPDPLDKALAKRVEQRIEKLKKEGRGYEDAVAMYRQRHGDQQQAEQELYQEIQNQEFTSLQSVKPGGTMAWTFSDIHVKGSTRKAPGTVLATGRIEDRMIVRIQVPRDMISNLVYRGPVRVDGVDAVVNSIKPETFDAVFSLEDSSDRKVTSLKTDAKVAIEADPTVQLIYKAKAGKDAGEGIKSAWILQNPKTGYPHYEPPRTDPRDLPVTLTLSARIVSDEGKTAAKYINRSPASVTILYKDIAMLYRVGSFGANFAKAMLLVMYQLAFLAALGVLAATFLSFPVACLMCFATLPFSVMREYLSESVKIASGGLANTDVTAILGHYILKVFSIFLPDFSATGGGDALVEGMYISWLAVAKQGGIAVALPTVAALAIACLVFHKRELARIQA